MSNQRPTATPQGTAAILEFAATLPQRAENLRSFFDYNAGARDLLVCKEIIERLAPFDPDIDSAPGEN